MKKHFAIFDIGKTNAKLLLFNDNEEVEESNSIQIGSIPDSMGHTGTDGGSLVLWMKAELTKLFNHKGIYLEGLNFSAHGASWAHIGASGQLLSPIYDYLLPLPRDVEKEFDEKYGLETVARQCGSPYAGMLNSGLQLFWIQKTKPKLHAQIHYSLHLPQYLSYVFTTKPHSEMCSIGCHTMLWDYRLNGYHDWLHSEGLHAKQAPIISCRTRYETSILGKKIKVGIGLHDSSASLYALSRQVSAPFLLLSTGSWCVIMNPGQTVPSSQEHPLYYLSPEGQRICSKRFPLGLELAHWDTRLKDYFGVNGTSDVEFDIEKFNYTTGTYEINLFSQAGDNWKNLDDYPTAYHRLIYEQVIALRKGIDHLVGASDPKPQILAVEGGYTRNRVFIGMLKILIDNMEVKTMNNTYSPALGALLALKESS